MRWEPGRKESAPFEGVQSSKANQNPSADGGFVYCESDERGREKVSNGRTRNVESLCSGTEGLGVSDERGGVGVVYLCPLSVVV